MASLSHIFTSRAFRMGARFSKFLWTSTSRMVSSLFVLSSSFSRAISLLRKQQRSEGPFQAINMAHRSFVCFKSPTRTCMCAFTPDVSSIDVKTSEATLKRMRRRANVQLWTFRDHTSTLLYRSTNTDRIIPNRIRSIRIRV